MKPRQGWYLAATSRELVTGRVRTASLPGREAILVRFPDGAARSFAAHCPHLGTHLRSAGMVGERLRCPLHAWEFDRNGTCASGPALESFPLEEALGGVFVHTSGAPGPLPEASGRVFLASAPVTLRAPWQAVLSNGFDVGHLRAVHERELLAEPLVTRPEGRFQLSYEARVAGRGLPDALTRLLSGGLVSAVLTAWGGSLVTVESRLGRFRASLVVALLPVEGGTRVTLLSGTRRSGPSAWLARFLYRRFLVRDVAILDGIDFRPRFVRGDDVLRAFLSYLDDLPEAA